MSKSSRHIGQTPWDASPIPSSDAVGLETTGNNSCDTAYMFKGEGTHSSAECKHSVKRIISSNIRVPVLAPDGEPLMPTKASRARKWIEDRKAMPIRTKLNLFGVVLVDEPSGRVTQPIALGLDPGSKFTGIAVVSKKEIHCGFNLELPLHIKDRMTKRRILRRNRRQRKCRRRKKKFLNRNGCILVPSIKARKQLELRIVNELEKTYPILMICVEDVKFPHHEKNNGSYFSHVEVGKNWLIKEFEKNANVNLFMGWDTSTRRKELGLKKSQKKDVRLPISHVNDAIALCSLGMKKNIVLTKFRFDIIRRPKYNRRRLHLLQTSKGGIRRKYGGTTTPFVFRKGDYVTTINRKNNFCGWVSGYGKMYDKYPLISISTFDWKRIGSVAIKKVVLLERNCGLIFRSKGVKQ